MSVVVATSLDDALRALSADPAPTVLAGGTDVMVEVNDGHRRLGEVVVVDRVAELCSWTFDPETAAVHIGAGITWSEIERAPFTEWVPALAEAARTVGSPQIRHAGTIGGNLGTCSPAGDGLTPLAALGATVHLASLAGSRSLPFAEFMTGPKRNARRPDELITGVSLPLVDGWQGFAKVGVRNAMVIATANVALVVDRGSRTVRCALGSVGPTVLRCPEAEAFAVDAVDFERMTVDAAALDEFGRLVAAAARPIDDHRSTADYRRHAVGVLARRLLRRGCPNG